MMQGNQGGNYKKYAKSAKRREMIESDCQNVDTVQPENINPKKRFDFQKVVAWRDLEVIFAQNRRDGITTMVCISIEYSYFYLLYLTFCLKNAYNRTLAMLTISESITTYKQYKMFANWWNWNYGSNVGNQMQSSGWWA